MYRFVLFFALLSALLLPRPQVAAQETWSLEKCIRYGLENNLTLRQAEANVRVAQLSKRQAKTARLPNISGRINAGEQYGRTIDPTTNTFNTQGIGFASSSLDANVTVFNGGLIHHNVRQAGLELSASEADAEQVANNLSLQIAQAYLNILLSEEQLESANRRVSLSQIQLNATEKRIAAGTLPAGDRFNFTAQIARDEQSAVIAQNNLDLALLSLKQLLQLEPDFDLRIEHPETRISEAVNVDNMGLAEVYVSALGTQANVRAADLRIQSAEEGVSAAKARYYPSLSLFASLSSSYSTQYREVAYSDDLVKNPVPNFVELPNVTGPVPVYFYNPSVTVTKPGLVDQYDTNFGQSFGLSLNVPLYQNGLVRLNVERARLNVMNAQLQSTQTRQTLKNDIQTALANARAGRRQLDAAQRTFEAMQSSFQNTEKRHTLGAVSTLELTTARNNLDVAENDVIVARYNYLFRLKILDFYQGKTLTLD